MKGLYTGITGVGYFLIAMLLTLGSLAAALAETPPTDQAFEPDEAPTATPIIFTTPTMIMPLLSATPISFSGECEIPQGWVPVIVGKKDTLESLAEDYDTTEKRIRNGNCLESSSIQPDDILYLPPVSPAEAPTSTRKPPPVPLCHPYRPNGWVKYKIKAGDTLSEIAETFDVSYTHLQQVNCIFYPDYLIAGEILYVPYNPTNTPTPKPSKTPTPTNTATETATPTETPSPTP